MLPLHYRAVNRFKQTSYDVYCFAEPRLLTVILTATCNLWCQSNACRRHPADVSTPPEPRKPQGDAMTNSNKRTSRCKTHRKAQKPYPNFPLFPHQTGRWAKCINRKFYYFGKHRRVDDLRSDNFDRLRTTFARGPNGKRGPVSIAHDVRLTRIIFKYAFDAGLIDRPA